MAHPDTVEAARHKTARILCENSCGIEIQLDGRRFANIRGDKEHVATRGYSCNKALRHRSAPPAHPAQPRRHRVDRRTHHHVRP
ncbi:hypothetical protein [Streptomyces avermitilis]|uniref:hypothetical protein n=1 Tax=Streptomyces avermitilis TaxID=33903 RepID=UPI0033AB8AA2